MVLRDNQINEPWWVQLIQELFAVTFIILFILCGFGLYQFLYCEEIEKCDYQPITINSNIGSVLFAFFTTVYILILLICGITNVEPWGLFKKAIWSRRQSFKYHLTKNYLNETNFEKRLEFLKYILEDYYLDTYYFDCLEEIKLLYNEREKNFNELEKHYYELENKIKNKVIENKKRIEDQNEDYLIGKRWNNWWSRIFLCSSDTSIHDEIKYERLENLGNLFEIRDTSLSIPSPVYIDNDNSYFNSNDENVITTFEPSESSFSSSLFSSSQVHTQLE
ncbi:hypothetical protein C1645_820028 [Glomus cerebriforme]|uniref:Uncharacterized protein n=1 Tax=Glomus cerebriforme TaxID=658196 RepID=A0A397T9K2_9GLOM|nr:hypothetical protein C1645_820028 [Glomus cerebriforme]